MIQYKQLPVVVLCVLLATFTGCKKFLAEKSDKTLSTINTLKDLRLLLDGSFDRTPQHQVTASDEHYITEEEWLSVADPSRLSYIWDGPFPYDHDWTIGYKLIHTANTILVNVDQVKEDGLGPQRDQIRATALFIRAHQFYQMATQYALDYNIADPGTGLGIVLRLDDNFETPSVRADLKTTYTQIINDLEESVKHLPNTELYKTRPSKASVYALLARIYLQIGQYNKARERASACIALYPALLDFNNLDEAAAYPAGDPIRNPEILYYCTEESSIPATFGRVDTSLADLYTEGDLRKKMFLTERPDGTPGYRGSYTGESVLFTGLTNAEVYLVRAEAYAREGDAARAIDDLNTLRKARWKASEYAPLVPGTPQQALLLILTERRKELLFRGLRWSDLKRLNREPAFQVTVTRKLGNKTYTLPPNDNRYALLIPELVMQLSNMQQNPR